MTRNTDQLRVLIIGSGSAGKRHAKNLAAEGCAIAAVDPRADRRTELAGLISHATVYETLDLAMQDSFDGVVVASPTGLHFEHTSRALEARLPTLLEKPPSTSLAETQAISDLVKKVGVPILLGYSWRWWPPLDEVRRVLSEGTLGPIYRCDAVMSAHLADWHPWERYQDFFMSNKELGGGALLDESHWVDLMISFFGMPQQVWGSVDRLSFLEIETDDNVDAVLFWHPRPRVSVHLDLYGRPHEKSIRITGERGSLLWTEQPNQLSIAVGSAAEWTSQTFEYDRNEMFQRVASDFVAMIRQGATPSCDIEDGIRVMRVVEAIRLSTTTGSVVSLT